jgi:hypothetical protein
MGQKCEEGYHDLGREYHDYLSFLPTSYKDLTADLPKAENRPKA